MCGGLYLFNIYIFVRMACQINNVKDIIIQLNNCFMISSVVLVNIFFLKQ